MMLTSSLPTALSTMVGGGNKASIAFCTLINSSGHLYCQSVLKPEAATHGLNGCFPFLRKEMLKQCCFHCYMKLYYQLVQNGTVTFEEDVLLAQYTSLIQ